MLPLCFCPSLVKPGKKKPANIFNKFLPNAKNILLCFWPLKGGTGGSARYHKFELGEKQWKVEWATGLLWPSSPEIFAAVL